jgi:PAS domain-containing protein
MFIHDNDFRIIRANKSYMAAAGLTESEVIGSAYYSIFPKMEGPFAECHNLVQKGPEEAKRSGL